MLGNLLDHSWLESDSLSLCSGTSMLWIDLMQIMVTRLMLMILSMMMILSMLMVLSMLVILQGPLYSGPAFEMPLQRARGAAEGD